MSTANDPRRIDYAEFVAEFEWTRSRHNGEVVLAAPIFGMQPSGLEQRLRRAKAAGYHVDYICMPERGRKSA